ncbi:hypothetical protein ACA910_020858 [Epithemia clementina (nom. ined.)]
MRPILTTTSIAAPSTVASSKDLYLAVGTKDDPATQRCTSPCFTESDLKQEEQHQRSTTKRQIVRFQQNVTVMEGPQTHHDICSSMLWYTTEDYARFKETLICEAKAAMRKHGKSKRSRNEGKGNRSNSAVSKINQAFVIFQSEILQEPSPCGIDLDPVGMDELANIRFHGCLEIVGLERFLSKKICRDKRDRRCHLTHAVLQLQALCRLSGHHARLDPQHSDLIRCVSERISGPSKLMAWYLGEGTISTAI